MGSIFSGWFSDSADPLPPTKGVIHTIDYTEIWEKWVAVDGNKDCQPFKQNYPYVMVLIPTYLPPYERKVYVFKTISDLHNYLTMRFYTENSFPTVKETHEFFIANLKLKEDCDRIFRVKWEVEDASDLVLWAVSNGHIEITDWVTAKHIHVPIIEDI